MIHPQLETFLIVAGSGSFSKAADLMYLSKVSIMKQMDALEKRLGIKLFERTNHGIDLTAAGRSIYMDATRLKEIASNSIARAKEIAGKETSTIRVGTSVMRSCKSLLSLWNNIDDRKQPFQLELIPFDDTPVSYNMLFETLGEKVDILVAPIGTDLQMQNNSFLPLGTYHCQIAVPRKHTLSHKEQLTWTDLDGETMMLAQRGNVAVLDALRNEIEQSHPTIRLLNIKNPYDVAIFNECERMGYIMETLDVWSEVHPSLITIPMEWNYEIPYGIIYSKNASQSVLAFIDTVKSLLN
ncbi:MAG: LysR family transcriptional regulator [Lachnospiraceae bacterium]|nr:LysR family transcriptional regulator [Lachnospiraceae bacterium]MDD3797140.1 LysR family transcriptional regulator [Lachnospiraceae bacterium]